MTTLPLPIDDATATAYQSASPTERRRIAQDFFRFALLPNGERTDAYRRAANALGADAQAAGWDGELDAALLRGDLDGE